MNGRELAQTTFHGAARHAHSLHVGLYRKRDRPYGTLDPGVNLLRSPLPPALKTRVREALDTPLPLEVQMSAQKCNSTSFSQEGESFALPCPTLHSPLP